jgi:dihydrolipoamide dehydrogenase
VENLDDMTIGPFLFHANGWALSMDASGDGGFVRVIARKADHRSALKSLGHAIHI